MELVAVLIEQPKGDLFFITAHVVVGGPMIAPRFATAGIIPDLHRGVTIHTQALDRPSRGRSARGEGLTIPFGEVGEEGIGFWEFLWGLALITLRRR